jgi:hypothetical protein
MANIYSIENLLVGKIYRSGSLTGEIVDAEKDYRGLWYGENTDAYIIRVRGEGANYQYRTVAVRNND